MAVFAGLAFSACNNSSGWSAAEQQKSLQECVQATGGKLDEALAKKYCSCVLDKAMKKFKTYKEAEGSSEADGMALAQACMSVLQGGGDPGGGNGNGGNTGGGGLFGGNGGGGAGKGWSQTDKQTFLNQCSGAVEAKGYSGAQARQLCNCALGKLEARFASLAQADQQGGEQAGRQAMEGCVNGDNTTDDGSQPSGGEQNDENNP